MNKNMKNFLVVSSVVVIAALGFAAYRQIAANRAAAESPATETAVVQRGDLSVTVEAAGSLQSPSETTLAFETGGRLAEMLVDEGQTVKAGDVLAHLDSSALELQLAQAELNLQLLTSPEVIAQTELAVINAREMLADAEEDLANIQHPDVDYYREQLADAQARLAAAQNNATIADVGALANAVFAAEETVERTAERLGKVKAAIEGCTDCDPARQVKVDGIPQTLADAQENYDGALNALTAAKLNLENAQQSNAQVVEDAQEAVEDAQANLDAALAGPDPDDVALYTAKVENAQAALAAAEALLADLKSGLTYESLADASPVADSTQGQLRQAILSVRSAELSLEKAALIAPVAGTVTTVRANAGEFIGPGAPLIVLSELSTLEAEVNLDETDVSRVQVGMPVVVFVDAFPGQQLTGQVTEIAPSANVQSGVVLYPVTVRVDVGSLPLRSGMTVNVTFPIEQRTDTLLVPFRAVETEGGQAYLTRVTAAGSEQVAVTMGLITDTQVEILSGIEEGDVVTVYANPVQDTELMNNPMFGGGQ